MEIKKKNTIYICLSLGVLFLTFAAMGSAVDTVQGRRIVFEGITRLNPLDAVSRICAASALDVVSLMLITLLSHPVASLTVLGGCTALRGAVLGASCQLLAANSASVAGVIYSVVYVLIALIICGYGVIINRNNLSRIALLCLYGAVSGTVVILRGLSMLVT